MKGIEDIYPLSPLQQGILFHTLCTPNTRVYLHQLIYAIDGSLDVTAFRQAWERVIDRHPILRSSFVWENVKEPVQVVHNNVPLFLEEHDWRVLSPAEQQSQLEKRAREDREEGFDLARTPLMRLILIRLGEDSYQLIWSYQHIIFDGWAGGLINQEVMTFYRAFTAGQDVQLPSPRPYRDYIVWLRQQDLVKAESFWRQKLAGFTTPTPLALDRTAKKLPDREEGYDEQYLHLSPDTSAALQTLAQRNQLTLNSLAQGIWGLLLSRYSGELDVVFGVVVSGRPPDLDGVESMVGLFINTLPVRVQVAPAMPVLAWLRELQMLQVELQQYEYSPLMEVQRWSDTPRGQPLFESIFAFENYYLEDAQHNQDSLIRVRNVGGFERTHYPLTLMVAPGSQLVLRMLYDNRCVTASAVARMLERFRSLAEDIVADPYSPISELAISTESESEQLISSFNASL